MTKDSELTEDDIREMDPGRVLGLYQKQVQWRKDAENQCKELFSRLHGFETLLKDADEEIERLNSAVERRDASLAQAGLWLIEHNALAYMKGRDNA